MTVRKSVPGSIVCVAALAAFTGSGVAHAELVYGLTASHTLVSWDSATPGVVLTGSAIAGLQSNEQLLGIDFRPATGELFAMGSFNNLYTLDLTSGAATLVGAGGFAPGLNGASFGFDFNPVIDRIRVVSETDQNLVLNPNDGTATGVTSLFYPAGDPNAGADPNVVASSYTNSFAGTTSTQLYGIDTGLDMLVTQANSAGTLGTVGSLGMDFNSTATFDISGDTGMAYAAMMADGSSLSMFYTIDLTTGLASTVGQINGGLTITSIAVAPPIPAPAAGVLLAIAGLAAPGRRRTV